MMDFGRKKRPLQAKAGEIDPSPIHRFWQGIFFVIVVLGPRLNVNYARDLNTIAWQGHRPCLSSGFQRSF